MKPSVLSVLSPQYIVDDKGKKTNVVLDLKTFEAMVEELGELHDIMEAEEILVKGEEEEERTVKEIGFYK
jgi:hypothetical protein